jgi:hypothetical protein
VTVLQWLSGDPLLTSLLASGRDMYEAIWEEVTGVPCSPEFREACKGFFLPVVGVAYTIEFFTTKKGFDRTTTTFEDPAYEKKPARIGKRYSDSIGCVVKTVQGTEAAYTLASDDLYVRARITSTQRPAIRASNEPEFTTAWTQPCLPSKGWF